MKRTIMMGLGVVAMAIALWAPGVGGSGFGASASGGAGTVASSDQTAQFASVAQEHPARIQAVAAIGVLAFGLFTVIGSGRRRARVSAGL